MSVNLLGAIDLLINARFQTDADMQGHKLLNLDTSNLAGLGTFGAQPAHTIFAGPAASGPDGVPSFRIYTPAELGAQPHGIGLDALSAIVPTTAGISLMRFPNPTGGGYVKNIGIIPPPPVPDNDAPSDTAVDLDAFPDDYALAITGTTAIESFILAEGDEHVLVFDDILTLVNSATLKLPGGEDITTEAGDYVVVKGESGGVVSVYRNYTWKLFTPTQLRTDIAAQPLTAGLTTLSTLTPTLTGQNFLTLTNPVSAGYPKINNDIDHTISVLTPAQVIADLGVVAAPFIDSTALIKGSADATKLLRFEVDGFTTGTTRVLTAPNYNGWIATIDGAGNVEAFLNKKVNGLILAVGTAALPDSGTDVTYTPETGYSYQLSLISTGYNGGSIVLRTTAPTDVQIPVSGVLATVAGTIPASYLSVDKTLGGILASDLKVSTQKAVKLYVDARTGVRIPPISDDTVDSDTAVDLTGLDYQLDVTGTETIEAFTMNEGDEHVLVFDEALTLVNSLSLVLPGGENIITESGDYAVVNGKAGGVVQVLYFKSNGAPYIIGVTAAGRALLDDATAAAQRTTLGLGSVENTSDAGKAVSTATQTALNLKASLTGAEAITNKTGYNGVKLYSGTGSPETVVTATVGSFYSRTDGGAATTFYVKESGAGNTGWIAK